MNNNTENYLVDKLKECERRIKELEADNASLRIECALKADTINEFTDKLSDVRAEVKKGCWVSYDKKPVICINAFSDADRLCTLLGFDLETEADRNYDKDSKNV